jgi:hypothetical protein
MSAIALRDLVARYGLAVAAGVGVRRRDGGTRPKTPERQMCSVSRTIKSNEEREVDARKRARTRAQTLQAAELLSKQRAPEALTGCHDGTCRTRKGHLHDESNGVDRVILLVCGGRDALLQVEAGRG